MGTGLLEPAEIRARTLRYWVGDMIGIAVVTPFVLMFFTRRRTLQVSWRLPSQFTCSPGGRALAGVRCRPEPSLPAFLSLVPARCLDAVRFGLEGVTVGLAVTQIGLYGCHPYLPGERRST